MTLPSKSLTAPGPSLQCHGKSDRAVDGSTDRRGFPRDSAPEYLLRDRDAIYGEPFRRRIESMGIEQVLSAALSPRQNPYVERLIGSIRRDWLDHVIVLNERHPRRMLTRYFDYCHSWRTHLLLDMDYPDPTPAQPTDRGAVVEFPDVGGLHHHYDGVPRRAR